MDELKPDPAADILALETERFLSLSSEMAELLEGLKREVHRSRLELQDVQASIEAGKQELEALCEIEKETSNLERQIEDLRRQKEALELLIADQQGAWEEEKALRTRKEKECTENLRSRREREEEEYRLRWEGEQAAARQRFEEELNATRQADAEARAKEETVMREREAALNKKERELSLLMQELEKFLSGLTARLGTAGQKVPPAAGDAPAGPGSVNPSFFGVSDDFKGGFNPDNALMWDAASEEP